MAFKRILLMVIMNLIHVPVWGPQLLYYAAKGEKKPREEGFKIVKKITRGANKGGRVHVESTGLENVPAEGAFLMTPNHQGMFDTLAILELMERPVSLVAKIELQNIPFLKQIAAIIRAKFMDRSDIKQNMKVIKEISEDLKEGVPYIIFPEGTRSKKGNVLGEFKGGSFKCAYYAKCPILPIALIDCYKPFDTNTADPVTVQVHFLKPIPYEEYKDMKTTELAELVSGRITAKIAEILGE